MQAGLLKDIVTIEELIVNRDASNGSQRMSWSLLWKGRARVTFSSGSQMVSNGEVVTSMTKQVQIRTKPTFENYKLSDLRITIKGQHYRPLSLDVRSLDMASIFTVELINE